MAPSTETCTFFAKNGRCKWEAMCRYNHDQSSIDDDSQPETSSTAIATKSSFGSYTVPIISSSSPFDRADVSASTTGAVKGFSTFSFGPATYSAVVAAPATCPGTGTIAFAPFIEDDLSSSTKRKDYFQTICLTKFYQGFSLEELRLADYTQGRRYAIGSAALKPIGAESQPANFGFLAAPFPISALQTSSLVGGRLTMKEQDKPPDFR